MVLLGILKILDLHQPGGITLYLAFQPLIYESTNNANKDWAYIIDSVWCVEAEKYNFVTLMIFLHLIYVEFYLGKFLLSTC